MGDEKNITCNGEILTLVIVGFNHDDLVSGGKAGITFGLKHLMRDIKGMSAGGRFETDFFAGGTYAWLKNTVFINLPTDLQAVAKSIQKTIFITGTGEHTYKQRETKIFLFTEEEIFGSKKRSYGKEGYQYPYFATAGNRIKCLENGSGKQWSWWEASGSVTQEYYCYVYKNGEAGASARRVEHGICFGFCV